MTLCLSKLGEDHYFLVIGYSVIENTYLIQTIDTSRFCFVLFFSQINESLHGADSKNDSWQGCRPTRNICHAGDTDILCSARSLGVDVTVLRCRKGHPASTQNIGHQTFHLLVSYLQTLWCVNHEEPSSEDRMGCNLGTLILAYRVTRAERTTQHPLSLHPKFPMRLCRSSFTRHPADSPHVFVACSLSRA